MASQAIDLQQMKNDMSDVCTKVIERTIGQESYQPKMVQGWVDTVAQDCVGKFKDMVPNYKFVVSVTILQKAGGLMQSSTCYWDSTTDCHVTVRWENPNLHCVVVAYAISF